HQYARLGKHGHQHNSTPFLATPTFVGLPSNHPRLKPRLISDDVQIWSFHYYERFICKEWVTPERVRGSGRHVSPAESRFCQGKPCGRGCREIFEHIV